MFKRQQFKDNESDETESSVSKCQRLHVHDNEKGQGLDKYKGECKDEKYVLFPFITPPCPPQKELYCPTDLGEGTKSLNHLVYILKICYSEKY